MSNIGFRVYTNIKRPPRNIIEKFRTYPTANIADNMNRLGCMNWEIKPVNSMKNIHLLGTAVTVKCRPTDNLLAHKALLMAEEGDILVIDAQGDLNNAIIGEIMCRYAASKGIKGFIVDGLIRDYEAISEMEDFLVFARGATPQGPYKDGPGEVNVPVSCGGILVNPGDIIVGDRDGVVVINPDEAEEIFEKTKKKNEREKEIFRHIEAGTLDRSWIDEKLKEKGCEIID